MHESMLLQFQLRLSNAAENEKVVHCFRRRNNLKRNSMKKNKGTVAIENKKDMWE